MKVGILGTGVVGRTLAVKINELGHEVMIGTRNVSETMTRTDTDMMSTPPFKEWHFNNPKIRLGTFADTAKFGEIIFLATHGITTIKAIDLAGKNNFKEKVTIDTTNPLDFSQGMPPKFAVTLGNSLGEQIQSHIPEARVVKAFNTVNAYVMVSPKREEGDPDLFIAGNDDKAKKKLNSLANQLGWQRVIDLGDITQSYWLEAMTMLWVYYGFKHKNWTHAFKLLIK
jgi:8-hydroxy-5-deazaflavin:NADPH oxidoreductase